MGKSLIKVEEMYEKKNGDNPWSLERTTYFVTKKLIYIFVYFYFFFISIIVGQYTKNK